MVTIEEAKVQVEQQRQRILNTQPKQATKQELLKSGMIERIKRQTERNEIEAAKSAALEELGKYEAEIKRAEDARTAARREEAEWIAARQLVARGDMIFPGESGITSKALQLIRAGELSVEEQIKQQKEVDKYNQELGQYFEAGGVSGYILPGEEVSIGTITPTTISGVTSTHYEKPGFLNIPGLKKEYSTTTITIPKQEEEIRLSGLTGTAGEKVARDIIQPTSFVVEATPPQYKFNREFDLFAANIKAKQMPFQEKVYSYLPEGKPMPTYYRKPFEYTAGKLLDVGTFVTERVPGLKNASWNVKVPREYSQRAIADTLLMGFLTPAMLTTAQIETSLLPKKVEARISGFDQTLKNGKVRTKYYIETNVGKSGLAEARSTFIKSKTGEYGLAVTKTRGFIGTRKVTVFAKPEGAIFKEGFKNKVPFKTTQASVFNPADIKIRNIVRDIGLKATKITKLPGYTVNSIGKIVSPKEAKLFSGKGFGFDVGDIGVSVFKTATKEGGTIRGIGLFKNVKENLDLFVIKKPTLTEKIISGTKNLFASKQGAVRLTQEFVKEKPPIIVEMVRVPRNIPLTTVRSQAFAAGVEDITKAIAGLITPKEMITTGNMFIRTAPLTLQIPASKQLTQQVPKQISAPKFKEITLQAPKELQIPRQTEFQIQVPKQIEIQTQVPKQIQIPKQIQTTRQVLVTPTILRPPKIPPIIPLVIPTTSKKLYSFGSGLVKGYNVLVKRQGKYRQISGVFSKGEAIKLGEKIAKSTLAASFKLKEANAAIKIRGADYTPNLREFRTYKLSKGKRIPLVNEYIQRKGGRYEGGIGRLSTRSERLEIQRARKTKIKRIKLGGFK